MRIKSIIGLAAILAAFWLMGEFNRDGFRRDMFAVCLGQAGDGPVVTKSEARMCACMSHAAVETVPWKSRLPQSLISLTGAENERMVEAQKACRSDGGV